MKTSFALSIAAALSLASVQAVELYDVAKRVRGAVVTIDTESRATAPTDDRTFRETGSGVLIPDGQILTADQIVQSADWIQVTFSNGDMVTARVVSSEPQADIALLEVERVPNSITPAVLGDSGKLQTGDAVFAVHASTNGSSFSPGHVGAWLKPDTFLESMIQGEVFQTDIPLAGRVPGSPLFNSAGEVVGVMSQVLAETAGYRGVGFAIPANLARQLTLEERSFWSGITGRMIEGPAARLLGLPQSRGILIERLGNESPAARIGLRGGTRRGRLGHDEMILGGDVLLAVNDISLEADDGRARIRQLLKRLPVGARVRVKYFRGGKTQELETRLEP